MKVMLVNPWLRKKLFSKEERKLTENSVLLINETDFFPEEFYYIVPKLKEKCETVVIDANARKLDTKELMKIISKEMPDFVGIPTTSYWSARCPTPFFPHVTEITSVIKQEFPKIKVVVWGPHGTVFSEKVLKETKADFLLKGEPELKFSEIIFSKNIKDIKGVAYLEKGILVDNEISNPVNLNELPEADFSWIDFSHYMKKNFVFPVMASRGCPFNCTYCANSLFSNFRERDIDSVINEIKLLVDKGVKKIAFADDIFTLNKKRTIELCEKLSKIENTPEWHCQTRADCLDKELFLAMKKANCKLVMIGVESAAQKVLDKANKRIKKEQYQQVINISKETKLPIHLFLISFLPGETRETLKETVNFLRENQPVTFSFAVATPLPGSKLWSDMLKNKELSEGNYFECLQHTGHFAEKNFDKNFIKNYYKILPTEVAFVMGPKYFVELIKIILVKPKLIIHFLNKSCKMLVYRIKEIF